MPHREVAQNPRRPATRPSRRSRFPVRQPRPLGWSASRRHSRPALRRANARTPAKDHRRVLHRAARGHVSADSDQARPTSAPAVEARRFGARRHRLKPAQPQPQPPYRRPTSSYEAWRRPFSSSPPPPARALSHVVVKSTRLTPAVSSRHGFCNRHPRCRSVTTKMHVRIFLPHRTDNVMAMLMATICLFTLVNILMIYLAFWRASEAHLSLFIFFPALFCFVSLGYNLNFVGHAPLQLRSQAHGRDRTRTRRRRLQISGT
jgi:hypothetical protein